MKFLITILILKYCALELNLNWLGGSSFQESSELLQIDHNIPVFCLSRVPKDSTNYYSQSAIFVFLLVKAFVFWNQLLFIQKVLFHKVHLFKFDTGTLVKIWTWQGSPGSKKFGNHWSKEHYICQNTRPDKY